MEAKEYDEYEDESGEYEEDEGYEEDDDDGFAEVLSSKSSSYFMNLKKTNSLAEVSGTLPLPEKNEKKRSSS